MLESNEDNLKKTTQTKDEATEITNENEVISDKMNKELESQEARVESEVSENTFFNSVSVRDIWLQYLTFNNNNNR